MDLDEAIDSEMINIDGAVGKEIGKEISKYKVHKG